ncbi:MAG: hypothetical protein HY023_19235 [Chloroflexi bacterium]|nr:hypothetical protein [Chloroflexota bacterium]MBI3762101.1 hypothetical protein [Chloroflexota bacterium]
MFTTALAILGMFALRLGAPIVVTLVIGEMLRQFATPGSEAHGLAG